MHEGTADWYLLERNAGGQWGWLTDEYNLPIADAIAAELIGAS